MVLSAYKAISGRHKYQKVQTQVEDTEVLARQAPVFSSVDATRYPLQDVAPYHRGAQDNYQDICATTVRQRSL